jgi:hypothetical protein
VVSRAVRWVAGLWQGLVQEVKDWWLLWALMAGSFAAANGTWYLYSYYPDLLLKLIALAGLLAAILCLWWLANIFGVIDEGE